MGVGIGPGRGFKAALLVNDDFVLITAATGPFWRKEAIGAAAAARRDKAPVKTPCARA
jgi:hypothetical protein